MRLSALALLLCVSDAWCSPQPKPAPAQRPRRAQRDALSAGADRWHQLLAEYSRGLGASSWGSWPPSATPLHLSFQGDSNPRPSVLVVPVPVPFPVAAAPAAQPAPAQCTLTEPQTAPSPVPAPTRVYGVPEPSFNPLPIYNPGWSSAPPTSRPVAPTIPAAPTFTPIDFPYDDALAKFTTELPPLRPLLSRPTAEQRAARNAPRFPPVEDSSVLVEQFRAQKPFDPSLPPVLIEPVAVLSTDDYTVEELEAASQTTESRPSAGQAGGDVHGQPAGQPDELPEPAGPVRRRLKCKPRASEPPVEGAAPPAPPPLPRFERSLYLRGRLTVPRADFTEPYAVWWDVASGASRIDLHGGTTSIYRLMKHDGNVQSVLIREDRTGDSDVRRCVVLAPRRVSLAERALPVLPELQAFSFAGHVQVQGRGGRLERWRHVAAGHAGELGGARGEALTFRHELLVARAPDNYTTTPLRYSVRVDSSLLGADCDAYALHFHDVRAQHHAAPVFNLDIADACERVEITERIERVEVLREFSMLRRDPRYDTELARYKRTYDRRYADDLEEAVRKNVLIQNMRFTASGNRQGASFELTTNYLSDRLDVEKSLLLGVAPAPDADPGEPFPLSRGDVDALRGRLPRDFDWREQGGVTPVRYQAMCASCWAFATVGAVEGALFKETGRLVPLSEQALVDCGKPYGANGCRGTWPSFAYSYIKAIGLPALEEYTPYQAQVLQCRADSVPPVTRISGHVNVTANNILALKVAIKKYGPVVVLIDGETDSLASYKGKYYHDAKCRKNRPNHAVLAVGWTTHRSKTYFILKNSWSAGWGVDGYVYMRADTNTCGVLRRPSLPRLAASDVQRVPSAARAAAAPPAV